MNKYEFYSKLLQEVFPVQYRQDFAEHDSEQRKKIQDLKEQLAEALWHLDGVLNNLPEDLSHRFGGSRSFLARYAQAEQQE